MLCQNANKCIKPRHDKCKNNCEIIKCEDLATHGLLMNKVKIYCEKCKNQLVKANVIKKEDYLPMSKHCATLNCDKTKPKYGIRGITPPTHCSTCAKGTEMVNITVQLCEIQEDDKFVCNSQANKKKIGDKSYCSTHATMISEQNGTNIISTSPKCIVCKNIEPTFILDSNITSKKPTHCKKCAENTKEPYHDIKHNTFCEVCKAGRPTFGIKKGEPTHCGDHKTDEMFDVCNKMCEVCEQKDPPIRTRASFKDDNGILRYCYHCDPKLQEKLEAQAKLVKPKLKKKNKSDYCPRCPDDDNQKAKMYGWAEDNKKMFCFDHKEDGMINVISSRCVFSLNFDETEEKDSPISESKLCGKIALFGNDIPTRCEEHKNGMKRLVGACIKPNCDNRASYGIRNRETDKNKKPIYCVNHKTTGYVDVSHTLCKFKENDLFKCDTRASFPDQEGGKEIFCYTHNINNTTQVTHIPCSFEICKSRPSYGYLKGNGTSGKAERCYHHRLDQMVNVILPRCISCFYGAQSQTQANRNKQKNMCYRCWINTLTDDDKRLRKFIRKETRIVGSLNNHERLKNVSLICDKQIGGGCTRRPDILIRQNTHNIIIEIDEQQHNHSFYNDEDLRIIEIQYALQSMPLIVIRFNPDSYFDATGKKYNGLFTGTGEETKIFRQNPYNEAIDELAEIIYDSINSHPVKNLSIIYLRYTPQE